MHPDDLGLSNSHHEGRPEGLDPQAALNVDRLCDAFELDWRELRAPRIEAFLLQVSPSHRATLLIELLSLEIELGREEGAAPDVADYRERFPGFEELVTSILAEQPPDSTPRGAFSNPSPDVADDSATPAERRIRFRITRLLNRGGTADLFVARDTQLHRDVALKQVQDAFSTIPEHLRRLEIEAQVTGSLEHPGVAPVHVAGHRSNGEPFFVMRLIGGRSFKEEIAAFHEAGPTDARRKYDRASLRPLLERLIDVGNTIAYAHSKGIIHRDLKPANIIGGDFGETVVLDWGLAKCLGAGVEKATDLPASWPRASIATETIPGSLLGTPGYLSPEQASGAPEAVGPACDIYSLGATLYHALIGRPPFDPNRPLDVVLDEVRHGRFERPKDRSAGVPADLEAICLKAMALRPEDRYPEALALVRDLESWLTDEPVSARREPWGEWSGRWARRHRTSSVAATIVALAATVFATTAWQRAGQERQLVAERVAALQSAEITAVPELINGLHRESKQSVPLLRIAYREASKPEERLRLALALLPFDPGKTGELIETMLGARADTVRIIRDQIRDHRSMVEPRLWGILEGEGRPPGSRFRAACVLASLAAEDARWVQQSAFVFGQLEAEVGQSPSELGTFTNLLRPIRRVLLPDILLSYRSSNASVPTDFRRRLARGLLLEYFGDDPEVLADVIPDASDDDFGLFFEGVSASPARAVPILRRAATRSLHAWLDPGEEREAKPPSPELVARIEHAGGEVDPQFAYCQTMPLREFLAAVDALQPAHYRPLRIRPYPDPDGTTIRVAAVWTRDSVEWSLASAASVQDVKEQARMWIAQGREISDLAAYPTRDNDLASQSRFLVVSISKTSSDAFLLKSRRRHPIPQENSLCYWNLWPTSTWLEIGPASSSPDETLVSRQPVRGPSGSLIWSQILVRAGANPAPLEPLVGDESSFLDRCAHGGTLHDIAIESTPGHEPVYSAVWWSKHDNVESALAHGPDPESHRERCRDLARRGYRPIGIAVVPRRSKPSVTAASVWQRPNPLPAMFAPQDRRIAQAAATLLRLGDEEAVWPLFRHDADPGIRSYLIARIRPVGVRPERLVERYRSETDASARRTLIQAIGEYPANSVSVALRAELLALAARQYRDEPDPGLHSALGSFLDRWGVSEERRRIDRSLRGEPVSDRDWFVNGQVLTFAIVRGPVEFVMGHPTQLQAEDQRAHPHHVRIERSFAIGTYEVTVAQFERFLADHPEAAGDLKGRGYRRLSPDPDCPMTGLDWFQAAKFCRWLDEQEHIPEQQSPYPRLEEIKEGMTLPEGYQERTGYRLPTQAEWEYASRAGAESREFYGRWDGDRSPPELLRRHAWCLINAENRTHPIGTLASNDFGLFDVLGNAQEWCGDRMGSFCQGHCHLPRTDAEASNPIGPRVNRIRRGGSFGDPLPALRVGLRSWGWPIVPDGTNGLRVARTLPAKATIPPR